MIGFTARIIRVIHVTTLDGQHRRDDQRNRAADADLAFGRNGVRIIRHRSRLRFGAFGSDHKENSRSG